MKTIGKTGEFLLILSAFFWASVSATRAQELEEFFKMSIEELMNARVTLASGVEESLIDAPAAIVVITPEDIKQRGYTSLSDVLMDLPGFDISVPNGAWYLVANQRGYRTPMTSRTLLMIDGKVDNNLWSNVAHVSRQYPLTNIKRIEVLYGPASAVYGANAFLGIISVTTDDGKGLNSGESSTTTRFQAGSFDTKSVDASTRGKIGDVSYALSGRFFGSDEPDLSHRWGFLSNEMYSNKDIWGPLLDIETNGKKLGAYYDPTDDYGIIGNIGYRDLRLGLIKWKIKEGYGAQYSADRGQNNGRWIKSSMQLYLQHGKNIFENVSSNTLMLYRESRMSGDWAEATPDLNPGMEGYSHISFTYWNCPNNSWLFEQDFEIHLNDNSTITTGIKYERKELTKSYDVPGYWEGAFGSSVPADDLGSYGYGFAIGHSTDSTYTVPPPPSSEMPSLNLTYTEDYGGFAQGIFDLDEIRLNAGIRLDHNSVYGRTVNPRISAIYKLSNKGALKLIYGEAFQEPPPIQLWGGWSGRLANPGLKPEKARNIEAIAMCQTGPFSHDLSLFIAHYTHVIKEEAENAGKRDIYGFEYRSKFAFENSGPISDVSGYFYYTYTKAKSSIHYNHSAGTWEEGEDDLGDIAPHKVNFGLNLPVMEQSNLFLSGNYVSKQDLYLRNPLRAKNEKLDSYLVMNCNIRYVFVPFSISLRILNLLDCEYFHPGVDAADAGDDFEHRSLGFHNSLLPQPGRSFVLNITVDF